MNSFIQGIYDLSPVLAQDALVTLYGGYLRWQRYGRDQRNHLRLLRESQFYSQSRFEELQSRWLSELVSYAYDNVPYYKRKFDEAAIKPYDIRGSQDLWKLPIVTKEELRRNAGLFLSRKVDKSALVTIHTSGTTGTPLTLWFTKQAIQNNYAFYARALEWAGVKSGQRSATFAGRVFVPKNQDGPPFWRQNFLNNNTLFSSYHLSETNIPAYVKKLLELNPVFIDSYPSAIYTIAQYIIDKGIPNHIRPLAIITSSETLLSHQREAICRAFGCKVFDQYGNAEMAAFVCQCELGSYHVNMEYGILELLDDGKPVPPGVGGELVCTGFLNNAMPLIRYKIGDSAVFSSHACECGRQTPCLESVEGRVDDIITTKDGRMIGRLDPVFKGTSGVKEAQIVQTEIGSVVVKVVTGEGFNQKGIEPLLLELNKRLGLDTAVTVEYVDRIERTSAGKFRSVVSLLSKHDREKVPSPHR